MESNTLQKQFQMPLTCHSENTLTQLRLGWGGVGGGRYKKVS